MKIRLGISAAFVVATLIADVFALPAPAKPTPVVDSPFLENDVPAIFLPTSSNDGFYSLCRSIRIPCGEERLPEDTFIETPDYVLRKDKRSIRAYLDKLIEYHPKYLWEIDDGVLVFRPRTPVQSPLDMHIARFISTERYPGSLIDSLAAKAWIYIERVQFVTVGPVDDALTPKGKMMKTHNEPANVTLIDSTVRQILNAIVHSYGSGIWIYTYSRAPRFLPNFLRRGTLKFLAY